MRTLSMPTRRDDTPPPRESGSPVPEGISILGVLGAIRRRKRLILCTLLLANSLLVAVAVSLTPRYVATATLMIDPASPRVLEGGTILQPASKPGDDPSLLPTQINLLKSPTLVLQVITALGMEKDPELRPGLSWFAPLRRWLSAPPAAPAMTDAEDAVPGFLERLSVGQQRESLMIAVSYRSGDPAKAARVANAVARQYLDDQVSARLEPIRRAYRWVNDRLTELRQQLQDAEAAATDYMAANALPRVGGTMPDAQQPPSLRRELAAARSERAAKDAHLAQLRTLQARGGGYESLPEVAGSAIIQTLQQQAAQLRAQEAQAASIYGVNHPSFREVRAQRETISRRIAAETDNVVRGIVEDATRARSREQELEQVLAASLRENVVSEAAAVRLNELTRVVDAKSELHRNLLVRLEQIVELRDLVAPGADLVAPARVPLDPDFPRLRLMLGAGFAGSLILALALAALAEHLDRGLRAADDVERALGLPNLALVPRVRKSRQLGRPHSHVFDRPQSAYAESIRTLLLGIKHSSFRTTKVLLVTSTWPGEGKTTLAISMAAMAAHCGRLAVVVDLDLRHPSVAAELGMKVPVGLVEYIRGECSLSEVMQVSREEAKLHVIPVRGPAANPAEVLDSPQLRKLITRLRLCYDTVVLDVPPTLGVTDAQAVGMLADAAVFIAKWGATSDGAASNGVAALERAGVSIIGCALTQVDLQRHALYGYHDAGEFYRTHRRYFGQ